MERPRQSYKKVKRLHPLHHVAVDKLQLGNPWVVFVIIVRILSSFAIIISPWWGILIFWFCDSKDNYILTKFVRYTNGMYHQLDKQLDLVGFFCMYVVGYFRGFGVVLGWILIYRFIGYFLYLKTHKRWIFVLFPNMFEMVFFWYVVLPYAGMSSFWLTTHTLLGLSVLFVIKIGIELFIHVYQPYHFMKLYSHARSKYRNK